MSEILLHIGRNKTGTSALQKFLHSNRDVLDDLDINYISVEKSVNTNTIFRNCVPSVYQKLSKNEKKAVIKEVKNFLDQNISLNKLSLISAENISNIDQITFNDIFNGYDIKVVAYIRNELDFLASAYAQYIQNNWADIDFENYLTDQRLHLSLNETFMNKIKSFKANSLLVRKYAKNCLENEDICKDFIIHALQLPKATDSFNYKLKFHANSSISNEVMEFKRKLVRDSYDEFNRKSSYNAYVKLSKFYGERYSIPKNQKKRILDTLFKSNINFSESNILFKAEEYESYSFCEKKIDIIFEEMLKRFQSFQSF